MLQHIKKINLGLFALIIFCFGLPFVNITCSEQKWASLTGFELAVGTKVQEQNIYYGGISERKVEAEVLATLAMEVAVAGIVITIINFKNNKKIVHKVHSAVGAVGFVLLLWLAFKLDSDFTTGTRYVHGALKLKFEVGYYLSSLIFLSITILNAVPVFAKNHSPTILIKCPSCGEEYKGNPKFCIKCGKELL